MNHILSEVIGAAEYLSIAEVAQILGVTRGRVTQLTKRPQFPLRAERVGKNWKVSLAALAEFQAAPKLRAGRPRKVEALGGAAEVKKTRTKIARLAQSQPQPTVEIVRSFSFKLNLGNYQSADFFCSQKVSVAPDMATEASESTYQWCFDEVMKSVANVKRRQREKAHAVARGESGTEL